MEDLAHVTPGDPLVISAATWNSILDATREHRSRGPDPRGPGGPAAGDLPPALVVRVSNATGGTLTHGSIVRPTGTVHSPTADVLLARRSPALSVAAPAASTDPVLICYDSVPNGTVGRAVVAGVAVTQVLVTDAAHRYARPVAGDTTTLQSAHSGPVYLIPPVAAGTANRYVLVLPPGNTANTASGADSCAAVLLAGAETCVRASVVSATGLCASSAPASSIPLAWDTDHFESAAGAWSTGTTTGQITYTPGSTPAATIGGAAGVYLGCSGDGGALFAWRSDPPCASGTATPCGDSLVVRFDCECCSIDGWDGAGWYCVRDAGSGDPCEPQLLTDADRCDDTIEICSGPHADEAAALVACPSAPTAPCQTINFSTGTFTVSFQNRTGDCTCLPTSPTVSGTGTDTADISTASCPGNLSYELRCSGGQYVLTVGGGVTATLQSFTASPFDLVFLCSGYGANCGTSGTAELRFQWTP